MEMPSMQYLEALTDVELLILKKSDINALYDQYKIWERFGRRNFAATYPQIVQQVPQYYIACYLGLTPEHLSRLRKKA